MFHTLPVNSPVQQDFIWAAEYANGDHLAEFDFSTHEEHSFYSIKKKDLIRFGLVGLGNRMYFECFGGSFKVGGRMIDFAYKVEGKVYPLSGRGQMYNDIITYKDVESFADLATGKSHGSRITQFNFGYKTKIVLEDVEFNFQALYQMPLNNAALFNISLVSNNDLEGKFLVLRNGQIAEVFEAPLKANVGGELNWILN